MMILFGVYQKTRPEAERGGMPCPMVTGWPVQRWPLDPSSSYIFSLLPSSLNDPST